MLYYNVIISWALFYFVSSFRTDLLWKKCGYWWNDAKCFVPGVDSSPYVENGTMYNCTAAQYENSTMYNFTAAQYENSTMYECVQIDPNDRVTATEQFYL
jgi:hypothetical protein